MWTTILVVWLAIVGIFVFAKISKVVMDFFFSLLVTLIIQLGYRKWAAEALKTGAGEINPFEDDTPDLVFLASAGELWTRIFLSFIEVVAGWLSLIRFVQAVYDSREYVPLSRIRLTGPICHLRNSKGVPYEWVEEDET